MNARPPFDFGTPLFSSQVPQKTNLEAIMENMLLT